MYRDLLNHRSWDNSRSLNHCSWNNSRLLNHRSRDNSRSLNHRSFCIQVFHCNYYFVNLIFYSRASDFSSHSLNHHFWSEVSCFFRRAFIQISIVWKISFYCSFLVFFIFFDAFFFSLRRTLSIHMSSTFKINFKNVRRWFWRSKITFSIFEFIEINE